MEVQGKIKLIGETQSFGTNGFTKRELVITTDEQYPQHLMIEFIKDKCVELDKFQVGQDVIVHINLRGREWTNPEGVTKYFNSIQGWRIQIGQNGQPAQPTAAPASMPTNTPGYEEDDLPF